MPLTDDDCLKRHFLVVHHLSRVSTASHFQICAIYRHHVKFHIIKNSFDAEVWQKSITMRTYDVNCCMPGLTHSQDVARDLVLCSSSMKILWNAWLLLCVIDQRFYSKRAHFPQYFIQLFKSCFQWNLWEFLTLQLRFSGERNVPIIWISQRLTEVEECKLKTS